MSHARRLIAPALTLLALAALPATAQAVPDLSFSPADPLVFPDSSIGLAVPTTATVKNDSDGPVDVAGVSLAGADAGELTIDGTTCSGMILPGGSCDVSVTLHPTRAGTLDAQLVVAHDGFTQPLARELTGTILPVSLAAQPGSWDFGLVDANQGEQRETFSIRNTGGATAVLTGSTLDTARPDALWVDGDGCQGQMLAPGQTCNVQVGFDPSDGALYAGTLHVHGGDADLAVPVSGAGGVQRMTPASDTLDFGAIDVGDAATRSATLRNTGTEPFQAIVTIPSGGDVGAFRVLQDGCALKQIAPGGMCTIAVRFAPSAPDAAEATLLIIGGNGDPGLVTLRGSGRQGLATLVPAAVGFGNQAPGTASAPRPVTVVNAGNGPLRISAAALGGADAGVFQVVGEDCTAAPLAPADACTVRVRFAPDALGAAHASLRLLTDDAAGTATASLSGVGVAPPFAAPASPVAGLAFATRAGPSATYAHGRVDLGIVRCVAAPRCRVAVRPRFYALTLRAAAVGQVRGDTVLWHVSRDGTRVSLALPSGLAGTPTLLVAELCTRAHGRRGGIRTIVVTLVPGRRSSARTARRR